MQSRPHPSIEGRAPRIHPRPSPPLWINKVLDWKFSLRLRHSDISEAAARSRVMRAGGLLRVGEGGEGAGAQQLARS